MTTISADQVFSNSQLALNGSTGVRLNSAGGLAEVVGQDVKITAQDGGAASGRVTIDAIDQTRINSGRKVRLAAPVIDFVAQAVIVRGTPDDPDLGDRVPGMIWFHSGTGTWRGWDGKAVRTLKFG